MTSDNGFAANPVNGGKSGLLNMPSNDPQLTPKMLARSYTATNSIPNSSEKVNTENGIAEEVAKTVKNKAFASRSGMAAQSILNKIKAGETPADSEINELVYAAINDIELVQRAIDHGMAQNNDSQAFAVASRLEKKLAKNRSVSAKEFTELILSEFASNVTIPKDNAMHSNQGDIDILKSKEYNKIDKVNTDSNVYFENEEYNSPIFETVETRKQILATDFQGDKKRRADSAKLYGLSDTEARMLINYVGGPMCYLLNKRAREGIMTDGDKNIVQGICNALLKLPEYTGRTYRNLKFSTVEQYNFF